MCSAEMLKLNSLWLVLALSLTAPHSAQAQDDSDLLYYVGRSLGNTPEAQVRESERIIALVESRISARGIRVRRGSEVDRQGRNYPILILEPVENGNPINREVLRISRTMNGLPVIFSPYDLSRGRSAAFFDPAGTKLGVSYAFILGNATDSSFQHEVAHAETFRRLQANEPAPWGGLMKLLNGERMSLGNSGGYFRFASLDELLTTSLSLKRNNEEAQAIRAHTSRAEFIRHDGPGGEFIQLIAHDIETAIGLARQYIDLLTRALATQPRTEPLALRLGTVTRNLTQTSYLLDAYKREIIAGRGTDLPVPQGTLLTLYWSFAPSPAAITARLQTLTNLSNQALAELRETDRCIYRGIELADADRTNWDCLTARAPRAFELLVNAR